MMKHRLREAYDKGTNDKGLDAGAKRRHKVAHRVGQAMGAIYAEEGRRVEASKEYLLNQAIIMSQTPNDRALKSIRSSDKLLAPAEANPASGHDIMDPRSRVLLARNWTMDLFTGRDQDPSRPNKIPVLNLPKLFIQGESIDVDNIGLECETPYVDGKIMAAKTTLWINSRPYDPDHKEPNDFTNGFRIDIATDGSMLVGRTVVGRNGYRALSNEENGLATAHVNAFLDDLNGCVLVTALEYERTGQIDPGQQ